MNDFRELCHGKDFVRPPNNRNMKESPRKKCPLPLMFCAREPPASSQLTSTTADLSDSRRSQTTGKTDKSIHWRNAQWQSLFSVTSGNYSGTFFTAKALLTTTSSTGTCSSLEEAEVQRQKRSRDMQENEGSWVIHKMFPAESKNFHPILSFQSLVTTIQHTTVAVEFKFW